MSRKRNAVDQEELLLLECMISDRRLFMKTIGIIKSEYFEPPLNFAALFILGYYQNFNSIPKPEFIKKDTGIDFELHEIDEEDMDYLVESIEKHCKHAAIRLAMSKSIDLLEDDEIDSIESVMKQALMVSVDKNIGINLFEDASYRLEEMEKDLDERSIGYHNIDVLIDYIRRQEVCMFAGGSGVGKSILLQNIAVNLIQKQLDGVYITLELSEQLVSKRLDSMVTGIPISNVFPKRKDVDSWYKNNTSGYGTLFVKRMPSGTPALHIRQFLSEYYLQLGKKPDFICVDYLDIMGTSYRVQGNAFDVDKVKSEELREVIMDFSMYGFTASQLNRDAVEVEDIHQGHIAGGLSKINTADVAISVMRDKEDPCEYIFQPMKLRNSAWKSDKTSLYLDTKTLRLTEHTQDDTKEVSDDTNNTKQQLKKRLMMIQGGKN